MGRRRTPRISAIDLFCGAGGLSHGLQEAGITVVAGVDNDPSCAYPFETNIEAPFLEEGFETRVRLFADPLRTLDWVEGQDIELGGVHNKRGLDLIVSDASPTDTAVA